MVTLEQARNVSHHDIFYSTWDTNADGTPVRWRVNGKVKTWKRSPERVQIPVKHGLYNYGYITELMLEDFCLDESDAQAIIDSRKDNTE